MPACDIISKEEIVSVHNSFDENESDKSMTDDDMEVFCHEKSL